MSDYPASEVSSLIRVLFVCLGNICRSPMAEAVFRHKVQQAGLSDHIAIDSAGTGYWHVGEPPHRNTCKELEKNGIGYEGMTARQIGRRDLDDFDYILTMDEQNLADVTALGSARGVVRPFLDYLPEPGLREVPDPYYVGGYDKVYALVDAASDGLLAAIRKEHNL
jgi:protein-tyrosine phosphatase